LNWDIMASNAETRPGETETNGNNPDDVEVVEAQLWELRLLIKPLATLGKTLPEDSRIEMQKAVRALVEWALDVRDEGDLASPSRLVGHKGIPTHQPGLSFLNVGPPGYEPDRLRSGMITPNEFIEQRNLDLSKAVRTVIGQPLPGVREEGSHIPAPVGFVPRSQDYADIKDVRLSELEVENYALKRKVFKLIETLSIENAKNKIRIENLLLGKDITIMQRDDYPSEEYEDYEDPNEEF